MKLTEKEIRIKLDLVVNKLINLDSPTVEEKLPKEGGEAIGLFPRDFGIQEWDWPQGVGLYGLLKLDKHDKSDKYLDFLTNWYKTNIEIGLPSKNINTTAPLLTLVNLCDVINNPEYENLCLTWADWLINCLPRTKEGAFQHVTSANGDRQAVRLNESEMWIDTLFMTVLFLNKMGQKYNRKDWVDESINQMLVHIKYLYDKKSGLFYHGWSFNENSNFGEVFWCRGNSWFTFGILDYIEAFEGTMNPGIKKFLLDTFKSQVNTLVKYQAKSGLWHTVIDDVTSYEEVSGSAAIVTGILTGIRLGILDDSFKPYAEKTIKSLCNNIEKDGTVLKVSGGTGMGYNVDHYKNIIIAPMAYGQSLTIMALVEALNHL
ncbi:glycoside hydrolase family 88/105 protein [Clostridium estertheticum]|uniref:glycoside hydrolase family 88/105 protein n=1 Tax=Clostridium estertheticum TaxID=238834 RepID=UPI001C0D71C6|nr:glycoside hydrolase family 88 protein [Clostridium estertheticum]MBU3184747.1 glycoside hydrolase family 88 protein [Clostridium estertheticum]